MKAYDKKTHPVKKVFICSPFSPEGKTGKEKEKDLRRNISKAQTACRYAVGKGCIPYAPHLFFTQFLDDRDEKEREKGQELGLIWLKDCDELWVIGRRISPGMLREMDKASEWGIPVRFYVKKRSPEERILDAVFLPDIRFNEMVLEGGK